MDLMFSLLNQRRLIKTFFLLFISVLVFDVQISTALLGVGVVAMQIHSGHILFRWLIPDER